MLRSIIKDICDVGVIKLLKRAVYCRRDFYMVEVDLECYKGLPVSPELSIFPINHGVISDLLEFIEPLKHYGNNAKNEINEYLKYNCEGYIAKKDNMIIGFEWFVNRYSQPVFKNPVWHFTWETYYASNADILLFDIFVSPEHRKGGKAVILRTNLLINLASKGYKTAVGFIWSNNTAAIRLCKSTGFKTIKCIPVRRIFLVFVIRGKNISCELFKSLFYSNLIDDMKC